MWLALLISSALAHPYDTLPEHHGVAVLESVTPEMHWFSATFLETEWAGCRVGVPVEVGVEPIVACYFPAGRMRDVPRPEPELRPAWREAKQLVREHNRGLSHLEVAYVGTYREVGIRDFVPLTEPGPANERSYHHGDTVYAMEDGGLSPIRRTGGTGLMCHSGCDPDPLWLDAPTPSELAGTSVLFGRITHEGDERYAQAEQALIDAALELLPPLLEGERPATSAPPTPTTLLPRGARYALIWELDLYARPRVGDDGLYVTDQIGIHPELEAPLDAALSHRLAWEVADESLGLTIRAALDLPAERAHVELAGPDGRASREVEVRPELLRDGDQVRMISLAEWSEVARVPAGPPPDQHEQSITIPSTGDFYEIDLYSYGPRPSLITWTGAEDYQVQPTQAVPLGFPATLTVEVGRDGCRLVPSAKGAPPLWLPLGSHTHRVRVEPVEGPEVVQAVDGFQEAIQVELGAEQLDGAWVSLEVLDGERVLATHRVQVEVRATPW